MKYRLVGVQQKKRPGGAANALAPAHDPENAGSAAAGYRAEGDALAPARDPENPYARFFTRGRSFAELAAAHSKKRGPAK